MMRPRPTSGSATRLRRLRALLLDRDWSERQWDDLARQVEADVRQALERALAQPEPDPATSARFVFFEAWLPAEGRR